MLRFSAIAVIAALGFASFNLAASAQDAPEGPKRGHKEGKEGKGRGAHMRERMHAVLFAGITLSDDQKVALEKQREADRKELEAAKEKGEKLDRKAVMAKRHAAIRGILTADQAKVFDENLKKMEEKRAEKDKKGPRRGEGKGEGKGKPGCKECENCKKGEGK